MWLSPGMLDGFGRLIKVAIHPGYTNLLQRVVVHATPIQGPIDTGWQDT